MEMILIVFVLLLHGNTLAWATPETCLFPIFTHNNKEALAWIESRIRNQSSTSKKAYTQRSWSKYGRIKHVMPLHNASSSQDELDQFLGWLKVDDMVSGNKFFLKEGQRPKVQNEGVSRGRTYGQSAVLDSDMEQGQTLIEIPDHYCISDQVSADDPSSLIGSPWELRLASKLLWERAKSTSSFWYPFIKLLPSFIRLPLFFSEAELDNCDDTYIIQEVLSLRSFAVTSFHALHKHEIAGATFDNYVWALGIVYAFACKVEQKAGPHNDNVHLLVPFFGSQSDASSSKASIELYGFKLKLVMAQRALQGNHLYLDNAAKTSRDTLLYRGFVLANLPTDRTRIFIDLQDMVEWYLTVYKKEVELDKDRTMRMVELALHNFSHQLNKDLPEGWPPSSADFSVGVDGYIDPHVVCALSSLIYINNNQKRIPRHAAPGCSDDSSGGDFDFMPKNVVYGNGSMVSSRLAGLGCRSGTMPAMDSGEDELLKLVLQALKKRLLTILESSPSTLEEDEVLMEASLWEGFSDDEGGSHLCETCQWQTEQLSVNDFSALQLRIRRKQIVSHVLDILVQNCSLQDDEVVDVKESPDDNDDDDDVDDKDMEAIVKFLKWCEDQGARISETLAVTHIRQKASLFISTNSVRGVQALRDIEQGETLCVLPLKMGLFESHTAGDDSWHLAAAHLLREKSLGAKSKWASYIAILPRTVQSPFNLMPSELKEVQWWPVLRELIQVRCAIKKSFAQFAGLELASADFEDYKWAVTMVHSRAFTLPVDDYEEYVSYVLMPFMDMINHHYEYQADWMSVPVRDNKLEIIAKRRVEKGQELHASFGPRSNDNLFLYYGFVLEDNPFDSAQIFVSFQDAVHWILTLWESKCYEITTRKEREQCKQKTAEQKWRKAKSAIDDYAAGITEQRPEWWNLVNMWADHGYEYMQFQPSPSIYAGGIIDPSLLAALEAVITDLIQEKKIVRGGCKSGECNSSTVKMNLKDFFACLVETTWINAEWALRSTLCSESLSQALSSANESASPTLMVKVSLSLRCLDILNSLPTTVEEDKVLLKDTHASMHVALARRYRYIKKLFLKDFIAHIIESI